MPKNASTALHVPVHCKEDVFSADLKTLEWARRWSGKR